jgi:Ca2+-binding RTX toxin-like protein
MLSKIQHRLRLIAERPWPAVLMALVISMSNVGVESSQAALNTSPIGQGFTVTAADLEYILKQIKIAEHHVANTTPATGLCGALVGPGPNQIPSPLISFGLRTVDGSCNNLQPNQAAYGASDQAFPRLTTPVFKPAENATAFGGPANSSYAQTTDTAVADSQPRMISNLIVDQTSTNPAAVFVAGHPARSQANPDVVIPCTTQPTTPGGIDGVPAGCVPAFQTLFIQNVTTDVGLSPPYNSLFTIFGQFFDHGLDKITNGGNGQVFVPLKGDDPLVAGPDHIFGNADDLPANLRFMMLTRGTIKNDPVTGLRSAPNTDTPFVDQSQTYTSHSSHQVFLREYVSDPTTGRPVATGKFLSETDGGMATWATVKTQAATKLGLQLVDVDVNNIPMIAADQYGNFIPGPSGLPQYLTTTGTGLVEGNLAAPVAAPAGVVRINTAFLNDIAHSAGPGSFASPKTPDANGVAGGSLDPVAPGEYDNELLDLHFICGDGRCNENIGLTAIHQIFHMEHDRLVDDITATLNANPRLLGKYQAVVISAGVNKTFTFEERLFQAARFVTEMQYQHLVFEEFARKIQPAVNPFQAFAFNQTDFNPAIMAEFAHAVYRFGHSMLTDTIPRLNAPESVLLGAPLHNDISLFDGFLNPAAYHNGGNGVILDARKATGAIIMGLSDQAGNELDEFVADTLRNRLLGLPLDLPSLNMARARSEGIPSLNNVRKQIFATTNDGQMAPYANWIDFDQNIKHHASLVNFIAAYGKHPTIVAATTLAGKRAAAEQIVNTTNITDSADFLFSTGAWANAGGVSLTGVDDIDLWVGGLAEATNLFGGLLGPTFNYVFEKQLTDLQNGDRFYYLARTPGMNLRTQLEGNSFAELVMRNTPSHSLKADPFATADCKFELANLTSPAASGINIAGLPNITGPGSVQDDPATECDENALLLRMADGTIKYRAVNTVDPAGINGQSVYNGTEFADEFYGGNDNDTFWGGLGNDRIEGGGGDDLVLGGEGDDIITDFAGADILKGGPGNDAIDGGPGDDIIMPGIGKDFTNGGANINETFASEGDDFAIAGQGEDAVFGDGGDDWEEGGDMPDLLIGDNSSLFFDDHNKPGHDILIGQGGDDDYDMEGGDDIGVSGPGIEKIAGAAGYDWEIGLGDPQPQVMDLALPLLGVPLPVNAIRDRFNEVEALSGWNFDDTLHGDDVNNSIPLGAGGFIGCDALDQAGLDRIAGLGDLVPSLAAATTDVVLTDGVKKNSVTNYCLLKGTNVWAAGNILLGGAGSDTLEGRGANDILDGDKYLNVRLSVRDGGAVVNGIFAVRGGTGAEIGSTDLMENLAVTGNFGPGTDGMTLQQAVFAGKVNPGNIVAVREILTPTVPTADCGAANPVNCDTALFSGPQTDYRITTNGNGSVTVTDNGAVVGGGGGGGGVRRTTSDGIDTLWNMEQLIFCDDTLNPNVVLVKGTCQTPSAPVPITSIAVPAPAAPFVGLTGSRAFGSVPIGTASQQTVTLKNTGNANLVVSSITVTGIDAASFTASSCGTVTPGGNCIINVSFSPATIGAKSASLVIVHNATPSVSTVDLSGIGGGAGTSAVAVPPVPVVALTPLGFGSVAIGNASGAQAVTVNNTGGADLTVSVAMTGVDAADFLATSCGPVLPGDLCTIPVSFKPNTIGAKSATLVINNNAGLPSNIALTGTGVPLPVIAPPPITVSVTGTVPVNGTVPVTVPSQQPANAIGTKLFISANLDFGVVKVNVNHTKSVTVTNRQSAVLRIFFVKITGRAFTATRGNCPKLLGVGKSCKLRVTFRPTVPRKAYSGTLKVLGKNINNTIMTMSLTGKGRR